MSERKVLNKYYPADFDPSKIPRMKKKNKPNDVRIMAPFNMQCKTCGDYIGSATKFNAKKETITNETYVDVKIYRFHIKCKRCMAQIVFKTNPQEHGYEIEFGATECFMAAKLAVKQEMVEAEAEQEEEKINPMKHLENRTKASKQQMEASEQIQNLRSIKYQYNSVDINSLIESKRSEGVEDEQTNKAKLNDDDEIRLEARELLKRKEIDSANCDLPARKLMLRSSREDLSKAKKPSRSKISSSLSELKSKIKIKVSK